MSSETWKNIQEHKRKQDTLRERIQKRRRERQAVLETTTTHENQAAELEKNVAVNLEESPSNVVTFVDPQIEKVLQQYLCSFPHKFPLTSQDVLNGMLKHLSGKVPAVKKLTIHEIDFVLQKQAAQKFVTLTPKSENDEVGKISSLQVSSIEVSKLTAVAGKLKDFDSSLTDNNSKNIDKLVKHKSTHEKASHKRSSERSREKHELSSRKRKKSDASKNADGLDDIQALLSTKSAKEQDTTRVADEIQELLGIASTKELSLSEKFRSLGGSQVREFCPYATREECLKHKGYSSCQKLHFRKILKAHTDEALGDCSFLNTCFHMDTCKYVHYEIDYRGTDLDPRKGKRGSRRKENVDDKSLIPKFASDEDYISRKMLPPQWINCDIRYLDFSTLGKFSVIMADPPWDIHMELPYGTMQDDEMRALRVQDLSDDGLIFLWVTGRAMELGRELFDIWGYKRCDELIWVKTNQLQRLIRTGRTGHWLNHGKEHCLIGIKGNPKSINRRLDCDVLVAEVRATSHKPDEIYGIIERLSPGTRKLELFGRMHNIQPNWITLGNQLDGVHLSEYDVVQKFCSKYPDGKVTKPKVEAPKPLIPVLPEASILNTSHFL